jgi:hypothetical protein
MLVVFFPVGLYFLYVRLKWSKGKTYGDGKNLRNLGWCALVLMFFSFNNFYMFAAFLALTVICFVQSRKYKKNAQRYDQYMVMLHKLNIYSFREMAAKANVSEEQVRKDIEALIDMDVLCDAVIDYSEGEVILVRRIELEKKKDRESVRMTCPSCGASTLVSPGKNRTCEYCDSSL